MPELIIKGEITRDNWFLHHSEDELPASQQSILPLSLWLDERHHMLSQPEAPGVILEPDESAEPLKNWLDRIPVSAIHFPVFTDGRGYTTARELREWYGYTGQIRAVGDVLQDQAFYLHRCGFDALALRDDQDPEATIKALKTFSHAYQAAVGEHHLPLYKAHSRPAAT
jgi:uncharacterized protein (DUF934 family)